MSLGGQKPQMCWCALKMKAPVAWCEFKNEAGSKSTAELLAAIATGRQESS